MSNAERQRAFCKRNPGYYARLKARERAATKRGAEQALVAMQAALSGTRTTDGQTSNDSSG
jgi:hypothetical protein